MKLKINTVIATLCLSVLSAYGNDGSVPPGSLRFAAFRVLPAHSNDGSAPNDPPKNAAKAPAPSAPAEGTPIATTQQANGEARIDILSLKITDGDTMTLRYVVVNNNREKLYIFKSNIKVLDFVNHRQYSAGLSGECNVKAEEQQRCWAVFAAPKPKDNPQKLSVAFDNFDLVSVPFSLN